MIKKYKGAILFLVRYLAVYLILNTGYAWYIQYHLPDADPLTIAVTRQVAMILSAFGSAVESNAIEGSNYVPLLLNGEPVVEVFEGCNSVNVMVVFIAFLVAFQGPWKYWWRFMAGGLIIIYIANLLRVMALFGVALRFPSSLYFFHKFFFTGIIYGVVFLLWFAWIRTAGKHAQTHAA